MLLLTDSRIKAVGLRGGEVQTSIRVTGEQERVGRVARTCYIYCGWGRDHSLFVGLTPSGYFKRCPGKAKHELMPGILNSNPYPIVQTLGVNRVITL